MKLVEAIRSGKAFRRPRWVDSDDEFQWIQYNPKDNDFEWADNTGKCSGNVFGGIDAFLVCSDDEAEDYEVLP